MGGIREEKQEQREELPLLVNWMPSPIELSALG